MAWRVRGASYRFDATRQPKLGATQLDLFHRIRGRKRHLEDLGISCDWQSDARLASWHAVGTPSVNVRRAACRRFLAGERSCARPYASVLATRFCRLAQNDAISCAGVDVLATLRLPVARTPEEYVAHAVALAKAIPISPDIRQRVWAAMASSALLDLEALVRSLEAAYRHMWSTSFAGRGTTPPSSSHT